jgi:predicted Zn-dependent peptidase
LKAGSLISLESESLLLEELGVQSLNGSPLEVEKIESVIEAVTLNDVKEAAAKVLKGKVAIAAVGQTHNVPYVEDLV